MTVDELKGIVFSFRRHRSYSAGRAGRGRAEDTVAAVMHGSGVAESRETRDRSRCGERPSAGVLDSTQLEHSSGAPRGSGSAHGAACHGFAARSVTRADDGGPARRRCHWLTPAGFGFIGGGRCGGTDPRRCVPVVGEGSKPRPMGHDHGPPDVCSPPGTVSQPTRRAGEPCVRQTPASRYRPTRCPNCLTHPGIRLRIALKHSHCATKVVLPSAASFDRRFMRQSSPRLPPPCPGSWSRSRRRRDARGAEIPACPRPGSRSCRV